MIPAANIPSLRRALLRWHRRHALDAPWRESRDPYHALVAAVMAQQTQMSRVLPKYREFIAAFPTVDALGAASAGAVLRAWAPLGYNMRALRLHSAARRIAADGFPQTAEDLGSIDGIGPFTAAIIASFAFGQPVAAIDTNVRRIIERLLGASANGAIDDAATALLSRRAPARWNQAMMDLGALVCTARDPSCDACPLARWCAFRASQDSRPRLARVAEPRAVYRTDQPFRKSRRYYRGRIVQALREVPVGHSVAANALLKRLRQAEAWPSEGKGRDRLDRASLAELLAALQRDGLVHVSRGRVRFP